VIVNLLHPFGWHGKMDRGTERRVIQMVFEYSESLFYGPPPKDCFHVFVSYTSREPEVAILQGVVDNYCRGLWEWAKSRGVDIFYDHFSLRQDIRYEQDLLYSEIIAAINQTDLMTAFISPKYVSSGWCQDEFLHQELRVRTGRESPDGLPRTATHPIYWKPDIWSTAAGTGIREESLRKLLRKADLTDVTCVYYGTQSVVDAAQECVDASKVIVAGLRSHAH
jgi:hypothetical protein